jgi:Glycosyl transferases group 1
VRIGLFDDWWHVGHVVDFVSGLSRAALERGDELVVFSPEPPLGIDERDLEWVQVADLSGLPERRQETAKLVDESTATVSSRARAAGIDVLCDLDWRRHHQFAHRLRRAAPSVAYVVHRIGHVRSRWTPHRHLRIRGPSGRSLAKLGASPALFVVHTPYAVDRMGSLVGPAHVALASWPVPLHRERPGQTERPGDRGDRAGRSDSLERRPLRLLWVGGTRSDKGWAELLKALALLDPAVGGRSVTLSVVGADAETDVPRPARVGAVDIEYNEQRLTTAQLDDAYERADLALVTHTRQFVRSGRVSGTLISAVGAGVPVVVSSPARDLLPSGYESFIAAAGEAPVDLAAAIATASGRVADLERTATSGPELVGRHHSYDGYLDVLLQCQEPVPPGGVLSPAGARGALLRNGRVSRSSGSDRPRRG